MKILALDVGQARVGVAMTDDLGLTAQPLTVLARRPHQKFLRKLASLIKENKVDLLVLGLPKRTDGRLGPEAQRILALEREIKIYLDIKTATHDERYTTCEAHEVLNEAGVKWHKRQEVVDKIAAVFILKSYLDYWPK